MRISCVGSKNQRRFFWVSLGSFLLQGALIQTSFIAVDVNIWGFPKMVVPNNLGFGTTTLGNTHIFVSYTEKIWNDELERVGKTGPNNLACVTQVLEHSIVSYNSYRYT